MSGDHREPPDLNEVGSSGTKNDVTTAGSIVVGVDGTDSALQAVDWAVADRPAMQGGHQRIIVDSAGDGVTHSRYAIGTVRMVTRRVSTHAAPAGVRSYVGATASITISRRLTADRRHDAGAARTGI